MKHFSFFLISVWVVGVPVCVSATLALRTPSLLITSPYTLSPPVRKNHEERILSAKSTPEYVAKAIEFGKEYVKKHPPKKKLRRDRVFVV